MIEQRQDVRTGVAAADHIEHAQQQRDDLVLFRGTQRFENRGNSVRAEVD